MTYWTSDGVSLFCLFERMNGIYFIHKDQPMFDNRLRSLRSKFEDLEVDTVWIIQPENRRYVSGFRAPDGQLTESSGSLFISLDQALLLTDSRYTTQAEQEASGFEVITHKQGAVNALPEIFDRLHSRRLGFEAGYLIWEIYQKVQEKASQHSPPVERGSPGHHPRHRQSQRRLSSAPRYGKD